MNRVTFQELQAAICCPRGKRLCDSPGEKCSAWAYDENARAVEQLLGVKFAGRPLAEGERA